MSADTGKVVTGGTYADKQLFCKDRIVAWSHRSRFRLGRRLVEPYAGGKLLDYGCGDGTFLAMVSDLFPEAAGVEVDANLVADCAKRYATVPGMEFKVASDLASGDWTGRYDVVTCMEVLEHCVDSSRATVIADLRRLVKPGGLVLVSVPIEIGPSLVGKQIVRAIAGWRRMGDYQYRETYSPKELLKMVVAGQRTSITRPVYGGDGSTEAKPYHGHKGFNWKSLRGELTPAFDVLETRYSPLDGFGGLASSQVWFLCRPK